MSDNLETETQHRVVYLGRAMTVARKLAAMWLPMELAAKCFSAEAAYNEASPFECKLRDLPSVVGGAYLLTGSLDSITGRLRVKRGPAKFDYETVDRMPKSWVATWKAMDDAQQVKDRAKKIHDDAAKKKPLLDVLRPLRIQYQSTDRIGKLALEVVILDAIRNGKD